MMNLAEYRRTATPPRRFPALGGAGRAQGVVLNKDGSFSARRGSAGPISTPQRRPSSSAPPARLNNALRRLGSGWAIFVEAQRRRRHSAIRRARFPIRLGAGRRRAPGAVRGSGRPFRESPIT